MIEQLRATPGPAGNHEEPMATATPHTDQNVTTRVVAGERLYQPAIRNTWTGKSFPLSQSLFETREQAISAALAVLVGADNGRSEIVVRELDWDGSKWVASPYELVQL